MARLFSERLWESLPDEHRRDHFDSANMPEDYGSAFRKQTIPVDQEVVDIIRLQQKRTREFITEQGAPAGTDPRYLFLQTKNNPLQTKNNPLGRRPYASATFHSRLGALTEKLALTDRGRPRGQGLQDPHLPAHTGDRPDQRRGPDPRRHALPRTRHTSHDHALRQDTGRDGRA